MLPLPLLKKETLTMSSDLFGEVISSYTRREAIEDGVLVQLSGPGYEGDAWVPEMVAEAVQVIKPRIVYPYHFGNTDTSQLVRLLKNVENVEVRVRKMK